MSKKEKIINQNGVHIFNTPLVEDDSYLVNMAQDPNNPIQPCDLSGEDNTIITDDIMNVNVLCSAGDDKIYQNSFEITD